MLQVAKLQNLVMPNGQTKSNILDANREYADAFSLTFYNVAATLGTCVLEGHWDENATAASSGWTTVQSGGADVAAPAAGKNVTLEAAACPRKLRLSSGSAVTGDQTIYVTKKCEIS